MITQLSNYIRPSTKELHALITRPISGHYLHKISVYLVLCNACVYLSLKCLTVLGTVASFCLDLLVQQTEIVINTLICF